MSKIQDDIAWLTQYLARGCISQIIASQLMGPPFRAQDLENLPDYISPGALAEAARQYLLDSPTEELRIGAMGICDFYASVNNLHQRVIETGGERHISFDKIQAPLPERPIVIDRDDVWRKFCQEITKLDPTFK